jgi:hypothetical protein
MEAETVGAKMNIYFVMILNAIVSASISGVVGGLVGINLKSISPGIATAMLIAVTLLVLLNLCLFLSLTTPSCDRGEK